MLIAVSCRSPVKTQTYRRACEKEVNVSGEVDGADLDASHLQCVNGIRNAVLELILNRGSAEQE